MPDKLPSAERAGRRRNNRRPKDQLALQLFITSLSLNYEDIHALDKLVSDTAAVFNSSECILLLLNEKQAEALVYDNSTSDVKYIYGINLDWQNGLLESCIRNRKSTYQKITAESHHTLPGMLTRTAEEIICAPIFSGETVYGAISCSQTTISTFNLADVDLLTQLAGTIGQTISNQSRIQELQNNTSSLEVTQWQLLRSRNTLRALFDSIPTSIYIVDLQYNLAAINMHRANRNLTPPNRLVGRRCYEALYGRDRVCPECRVFETLEHGSTTRSTRQFWPAQQEPQEWEISTYPIHDENNLVVQAILFEEDVTEKRHLETTLAQSEKLAAVGQLAAGLAHEINNPLTAIIANAQLIQRALAPGDDLLELVDLILRAGNRASQVVRSLLDMARKEQYNFAPIDVNDNITKALALLQHEFITRGVNLHFEPESNLAPVLASQDHLQGVWLNLLTNAMDALENTPAEIHITTRQTGNEVRVAVTDSGIGIPPDSLSKVFEPFYTTKPPGRGTGLGLSVVHRIVKQHGGRILVDSKLDIGTQFTVILPILGNPDRDK